MKKTKQLLLPLLMALVMMAMSPQRMWAESVFTYTATSDLSSKFQYAFGGYGTVTCGTWTDADTPVTVTVDGDVKLICYQAFNYCDGLKSFTIPSGVETIGQYAFYACKSLQSIYIPSSVTCIDQYAFRYCSNLQSITISNGVTSIGTYAFSDCYKLQSINIPSSVTSIGNYAFNNCNGLESISVDAGNKDYDSRDNCNALIKTADNLLIQ